jgi:hypothetical protein
MGSLSQPDRSAIGTLGFSNWRVEGQFEQLTILPGRLLGER